MFPLASARRDQLKSDILPELFKSVLNMFVDLMLLEQTWLDPPVFGANSPIINFRQQYPGKKQAKVS